MIIHLIAGQINKIFLHKMSYFPEPYSHSRNKTRFDFDFSNYATKYCFKGIKVIDLLKAIEDAEKEILKLQLNVLKLMNSID